MSENLAALYASGATVRHAYFAEFHFTSEVYRVWNGFRNIELSGRLWQPVGPTATVDQIEDPVSDTAPSLDLSISGVSADILAIALGEVDQVRGQLVFIYDQYFDQNWQPVDAFETYAVAKMDNIKVKKKNNSDGSTDRVISIPSEYLLVNGANPTAGRYSQADQAERYPGVTDDYFEFIPLLQNKQLRWPTF